MSIPLTSRTRYVTFETLKFRNAPVSKCWLISSLCSSLFMIPFRHHRNSFALTLENIQNVLLLAKLLASRFFIIEFKDVIAGCLLIYAFRNIERRFGARKFLEFLAFSGCSSLVVEIIIHHFLEKVDLAPISEVLLLSPGCYALIFATYVQFYCDVPFVPYAKVFGVSLSTKNLPFIMIFQMLMSPAETVISSIAGLISGFIYRSNVLRIQSLAIIPDRLSNMVSSVFSPLTNLGEDKKGTLLPIGTTVEAQQQDYFDKYEQRLIFRQIRSQHIADSQNQRDALVSASRWFGRANQTASPVAAEDKVRALLDMGLGERQRVEQVLRATNNDLNSAAHLLLQQPVP